MTFNTCGLTADEAKATSYVRKQKLDHNFFNVLDIQML
jgi:hypothetical protein